MPKISQPSGRPGSRMSRRPRMGWAGLALCAAAIVLAVLALGWGLGAGRPDAGGSMPGSVAAPRELGALARSASQTGRLASLGFGAKSDPRDAVVAGRLYWEDTGRGVAGAAVRLTHWRFQPEGIERLRGDLVAETLTDGDGRFSFTGLAAGGYVLRRGEVAGAARAHNTPPLHFSLRPGEHFGEADCPVARGHAVSGMVLGPDGKPVPGARVASDDDWTHHTRTDGLGRFSLHGFAEGEPVWLSAGSRAYRHARVRLPDSIWREEPGSAVIVLSEAARTLSGVVVDEAGEPLAGLRVAAKERPFPGAWTDADGRFELLGMPLDPKPLSLIVRDGDYVVDLVSGGDPLEAEPGRHVDGLLLVARWYSARDLEGMPETEAGPMTTGVVVDGRGVPLAGADVVAQLPGRRMVFTRSAADGTFALLLGTTGTCEIFAHAPGAQPDLLPDVPCGSAGHRLRVPQLPRVRGRVVDAETGKPIRRFGFLVLDTDDYVDMHRRVDTAQYMTVVADAEGQFVSRGQFGSRALVIASAEGYASATTLVKTGGKPAVLALRRGLTLTGTVVDETGRPVPDAQLHASRQETDVLSEWDDSPEWIVDAKARTRRDGTFTLSGLREAEYEVTVLSDWHVSPIEEYFLVGRKRSGPVRIELTSHAAFEGFVTLNDEPLSGARVTLTLRYDRDFRRDFPYRTDSDWDGYFSFANLPPGTYTVDCVYPDPDGTQEWRFPRREIQLHPGETEFLCIDG